MPHLAAINDKYEIKGLRLILVDATNRKELTEKMAAEFSLKPPVLLDEQNISREQYKIVGTPTTYLIDGAGRIIFKHVGYGPGMERTLEKEIEALLARKST